MKKYDNIYKVSLIVKENEKNISNDIYLIKHIKNAAIKGGMTPKNLNIDYLHANYKGKKIKSFSVSLIVEESHIVFYTYPEHSIITIDVETCSNKKSAENILKYFKKVFKVINNEKVKTIDIKNKKYLK